MRRVHLRAADVMTAPVITVRPDAAVKDVAALMVTHHISGLPVVTTDGNLIGIVTEADLLHKEARIRGGRRAGRSAVARKAAGLTARDLMTSPVVAVGEETPLREMAALMVQRQINRLPILTAGRVVGIVSRADVVRALVQSDGEIAAAVRDTLRHDLWVDVERIAVDVRQGVVYLDGQLERRSETELVERWVAAVDGVLGVENRLTYEFDDRRVSLGALWPQPRTGGAR